MGKSLKGKELGKGISQRKDGLYQARFTDRFGKRRTVYAKTYTEITQKLRQEQYNDEKQLNVVDSNITLNEWFDIWKDTYKRNCRDTSMNTYQIQYNRIKNELGWRKLSDLSSVVIQKAFNQLKSDESRKSSKIVLIDMLNRAVEADLIIKNNALKITTKLNNYDKKEKRVLTEEEIDILYSYSEGRYINRIIKVALGTGMRIGEIIGLTWDCIDFSKNLIYVNKTLCYLTDNGKSPYEFHEPKTRSSKRAIPMSSLVKYALLEQLEFVKNVTDNNTPLEGFENLVFTSRTNRPLHVSHVTRMIDTIVRRINKDGIEFERFGPHCLRHTFATNCIAKGMNPKILQKILGHTTLQMTMDLYCHVRDDMIMEGMKTVMKMA